jgi:hypothetical protein
MVDVGDRRRVVCTGRDVHGPDARRRPKIFFSTNDPGIQQIKKIEQRFPSQPEVILAVSSRARSNGAGLFIRT